MFDGAEYSYSCEDEVLSRCRNNKKTKGKSGVNNKRRFSDEQIKSLESMFESETRLEPRKKLQLASELGLQPRQVAIWFQNKRARWKSKQLERDYSILLANYNSLASRFESLKKDKHALLLHLQKLNNDVKQGQAVREEEGFEAMKPSLSVQKYERDVGEDGEAGVVNFDVNNNNNNSSEPADSSLTSPDEWDGLNSKALFDESTSGYDQWWDFWS